MWADLGLNPERVLWSRLTSWSVELSWIVLVYILLNFIIPWNVTIILTSWVTVSFSRRILFLEVILTCSCTYICFYMHTEHEFVGGFASCLVVICRALWCMLYKWWRHASSTDNGLVVCDTVLSEKVNYVTACPFETHLHHLCWYSIVK
jgi:hypothetical protein